MYFIWSRPMNAVGNTTNLGLASPRLRVGQFVVELSTHRVFRADRVIRLSPKAVGVLGCLLARPGETLTRDQLIDEVWNSEHASDELLTQAIKELRRAFDDDPKLPQYIETIPKGGYRLIASVERTVFEPVVLDQVGDLPAASNEMKIDVAEETDFGRDTTQRSARARVPMAAWVAVAAIVVAVVGVVTFAYWPTAKINKRIDLPMRSITSGYERVEFPAVSPDGTLVAYGAQRPKESDSHLYIQTINGSTPMPLEVARGASDTHPVWSPDGTSIAFLRINEDGCKIHIVAATGGASRPVTSCYKSAISYFDWSPDGQNLITQVSTMDSDKPSMELITVGIADGKSQRIQYSHDAHIDDMSAHYSPDGRWIAFRRGANPFSDIFLMKADGSDVQRLTDIRAGLAGFAWSADGRNILFSSSYQNANRLYLVDIQTKRVTPTNIDDAAFPSISAKSNVLVALRDRSTVNLSEYSLDAALPGVTALATRSPSNAIDTWPDYSPRADRLCFVSDRSGSSQLWLSEPGTDQAIMLTQVDQNETLSNPQWAADGEHVLFVSHGQKRSRLFAIDIASHQLHEPIQSDENIRAASYAPDGKSLDIVSDHGGSWQLLRYEPDSGKYTVLLDAPVIAFGYGPDGKIYYTLDSMVGLFRLDEGRGTRVWAEIDAANRLAWRASKSGIFFIRFEDNKLTSMRLLRWSDEASSIFSTLENFGAEMPIAVSPDETRMALPIATHIASTVIVSKLDGHTQ